MNLISICKFPITKDDEIGSLAMSLNQLILSVKQLLETLDREKESQLIQSEKMASLGRMLAGVAHELNNPINFIYGNIPPAKEYIEDILDLLETYKTEIPNPPEAVEELSESIELDFLQEDLIKLIQSMQLGAERARSIVLSLKNFSRLDDAVANPVNLHDSIDSTLLMLHNRIKKGITVEKNYGEIPEIEGYMGLLYQVFMNLLSNALDALAEQKTLEAQPKIIITTERFDSEYVIVKIADNGAGIDSENQGKIFETFFTTKPRGVGTGLGLAITRQIVEEKHSGKLNCHSEQGEGTEFSVILPIQYQKLESLSAASMNEEASI
jgi:two-component system NtrC family sensor kinase